MDPLQNDDATTVAVPTEEETVAPEAVLEKTPETEDAVAEEETTEDEAETEE